MEPLQTLTCAIDHRGVATVTLNRPQVRNAFDDVLIAELTTVLGRLGTDPAVRVVVLTGMGFVEDLLQEASSVFSVEYRLYYFEILFLY